MEVLGKRLKWLRNQNRYSQKEIADKIGMSASGLQKIENNERDPKLDVLLKFCEIYNVSADFLLGRNNETYELKKIAQVIDLTSFKQEDLKERHNQLMMRRIDLENDIRRFKSMMDDFNATTYKEKRVDSALDEKFISGSLKHRESSLKSLLNDIIETEADLHVNTKKLSESLLKYIEVLLELPESKPSKDRIIKKFSPYNFEIQPDIFGEYTIHLGGKGVGFIGYYSVYDSVEAATTKIEELKLILNGTQHENILR